MMKRITLTIIVMACALSLFSPSASAIPSYLGPSGLILTPDAQYNDFQALSFSAHFFDLSGALKKYGIDGGTSTYAVNYSPFPALELGATVLDSTASGTVTMLNGKFAIRTESGLNPFSFSAGVIDALDQQEITPYFIASKSFSLSGPLAENQVSIAVNAGYGGGFYDDGILLGGEVKLHPQFSIIGERTKNLTNLGLRFNSAGLALDIGLIDLEDFGAGASYTWTFF